MKHVFAAYAHPIIFLFIGSFFLAEALVVHGLDRRFGLWLLSIKWVGSSPVRMCVAMGCTVIVLSMWISNTAAAAVMLPIVLGVLGTIRGSQDTQTGFDTGVLCVSGLWCRRGRGCHDYWDPTRISLGLACWRSRLTFLYLLLNGLPLVFPWLASCLFWLASSSSGFFLLLRLSPLPYLLSRINMRLLGSGQLESAMPASLLG